MDDQSFPNPIFEPRFLYPAQTLLKQSLSHQHGNRVTPARPDPRMAFLPPEHFNAKTVLEVGCGTGSVAI
jgi:hypothetical protein